jgi:hypothetical protein
MRDGEIDLHRAEELVLEARHIVQQQKGLVVRLRAAGADTLSAEMSLRLFERILKRLREYRDMLKAKSSNRNPAAPLALRTLSVLLPSFHHCEKTSRGYRVVRMVLKLGDQITIGPIVHVGTKAVKNVCWQRVGKLVHRFANLADFVIAVTID